MRLHQEEIQPSAALLGRADYGRIFGYLLPYWRAGVFLLLFILASAALGLIPPLLVRSIIDDALTQKDGALLTLLAAGMVLAPLASGLVSVAQAFLNAQVSQQVMFDLRTRMYTHLQRMSLRFYTSTHTGEIMSRLNNDVGQIQGVITGTLISVITNVIVVASTVGMIAVLDWRLTLVGAALLPLFIWPAKKAGSMRRAIAAETQAKRGEMATQMQETLNVSGFLLVRAFAQEAFEALRFSSMNQELVALNIRQAMVGRWFFMLLGLYGAIGPAIVYWYGGRLVIEGELSVGTVVAFVTLLMRLFGPASSLAGVHVELATSLALFERIFGYLDMKSEIAEKPGARSLGPVRGHIRFEDVSFSYEELRPTLKSISFEILPGQMAALVGPSGAGKTTVTYLLERFYDPTSGAVTIDGQDLRDVTMASFGQNLGIVPQEAFLFHDTIRYNVAYGRPEATEEELVAACQAAQIHDFIQALPQGYDTIAGERGHRLSGGEKQRLAIARVLLKDPRVLILDEATSSVDSTAEALIQRALQTLTQGRTTVAIAHRLSTILAADVILVLDTGRLVEAGTHRELVALNGLYASLYEEQFKTTAALGSGAGARNEL